MDYEEFLRSKKFSVENVGRDVSDSEINPKLFDFQKAVVRWGVKRGRAIFGCDTGLGKSIMAMEWARLVCGQSLILAPLAVALQFIEEGKKHGYEVAYARTPEEMPKSGLTVTNYERFQNFESVKLDALIVDECFPPNTLIDTPSGGVYISNIRRGDKILNAYGADTVEGLVKRRIKRAVKINVDGKQIISNETHPFFTRQGWKRAISLTAGDQVMATSSAMRMVQDAVRGQICSDGESSFLQSLLFSELRHESSSRESSSSFQGSTRQDREEGVYLAENDNEREEASGEAFDGKAHADARRSRESIGHLETYRAQAANSGRQRSWADDAREDSTSFIEWELEMELCSSNSHEKRDGLPDSLQAGPITSGRDGLYRSGWWVSSQSESAGCEEDEFPSFSRVESVEVLEQGHSELEKFRDEDGLVYFYDIKASRHPSFSVKGLLVHNCSLLASFDGKLRTYIIERSQEIPYRLGCSATPAPNDFVELGNHAQYLGIMTWQEMAATFFVHDGMSGGDSRNNAWRLKGHAEDAFWKWIVSWMVFIKNPSDIGFEDEKFRLPKLSIQDRIVKVDVKREGELFFTGLHGIGDRTEVRRATLGDRVKEAIRLVKGDPDAQWIVWCGLNAEADAVADALGNRCENLSGDDEPEEKARRIIDFTKGRYNVLVTKAKIAGMGLNLQNCSRQVFLGLGDSYRDYYQCIRRSWRFGQKKPVDVYIVLSDAESEIALNVRRKEKDAETMGKEMVKRMSDLEKQEILGAIKEETIYTRRTVKSPIDAWIMEQGDCVEVLSEKPSDFIDFSVYSPPFSSLYVYTNSHRDMGNCRGEEEFFKHFDFFLRELLRVTKPGRLTACHVSQLAAMASRDGYIGLKDFRGRCIDAFNRAGWIHHGEIAIQKNPQAQAIRTKAVGLLFATLKRDSSKLRPALADFILVFRKPGENAVPVKSDVTNEEWIKFAHPIWTDIRETETLSAIEGRDEKDEKHVCPLQLEVIRRCVRLWTNRGELVLSPFAGIGSEGHESVKSGRRFLGIELKTSYFNAAVKNLERAEHEANSGDLFRSKKSFHLLPEPHP